MPPLSRPDAQREMLRLGAEALGNRDAGRSWPTTIGSRFRKRGPACSELVEEGVLNEASVEGWPQPAYMYKDARLPRKVRRDGDRKPVRLPGLVSGTGRNDSSTSCIASKYMFRSPRDGTATTSTRFFTPAN